MTSERVRLAELQRALLDAMIAEEDVLRAWAAQHLVLRRPALFGHGGSRAHRGNLQRAIGRHFPVLARSVDLGADALIDVVRTNPTSLGERAQIEHWARALEGFLTAIAADEAVTELLRIERAAALARVVTLASLAAGIERVKAVPAWPPGAVGADAEGVFLIEVRTNVVDIYRDYPIAEATAFGPPRRFAFFSVRGGPMQRVAFASLRELAISMAMHGLPA